jgi:urease accessory protein UreE
MTVRVSYAHRVHAYRLRSADDGDDLGVIEHPSDVLHTGDVVLAPDGRLVVVELHIDAYEDAPIRRALQVAPIESV